MRSIPMLGSPVIRVIDARTTFGLVLLFHVLALPWSLSRTPWVEVAGLIVTGAVLAVLLHSAVAPPAWVLTCITLGTGAGAAFVAIPLRAPTFAAAIILCVVLQVSSLRSRREAWAQLAVMAATFTLPAPLMSASARELVAMVPVLVTSVLLTAVVTGMRRHLDEVLMLLHHRADHDPLTGLLNRQGLSRHMQQLQSTHEPPAHVIQDPVTGPAGRIGVTQAPEAPACALGLLVIDVDYFKAVNDRHGHLAGDEALVWLAGLLRGALPAPALLARFGGEEFLVVMPGCNQDGLAERAEYVRALVAITSTSRSVALTVSIGAAVDVNGAAFEQLVARADDSLYVAKRAGRNRVHIHQTVPSAR